MYDSEAIRAAAQAVVDSEPSYALLRAFHAEATPIAMLSMLDEIERLREDAERLDFTESASTTWYPGRAENGYGILCYDIKGRHRAEAIGKTMREAIDAAITQGGGA